MIAGFAMARSSALKYGLARACRQSQCAPASIIARLLALAWWE